MAHIPSREGRPAPVGGFEQAGAAREVAEAIARRVNEEEATLLASPQEDAAYLAVFAAYEAGNQPHARGDFFYGVPRSYGVMQLRGFPLEVADDPYRAIGAWLGVARASSELCRENPPAERLAALASGRCDAGRAKVRGRVELAQRIVEEVGGLP